MADFMGKRWNKEELLAFVGDTHQLAGARPSILTDGKAEGVKAIDVQVIDTVEDMQTIEREAESLKAA